MLGEHSFHFWKMATKILIKSIEILVVKRTSVRGHDVRKKKLRNLDNVTKNASSIAIQLKIKGSGSINGSTIIYELP
jgi:hypothetical protein